MMPRGAALRSTVGAFEGKNLQRLLVGCPLWGGERREERGRWGEGGNVRVGDGGVDRVCDGGVCGRDGWVGARLQR